MSICSRYLAHIIFLPLLISQPIFINLELTPHANQNFSRQCTTQAKNSRQNCRVHRENCFSCFFHDFDVAFPYLRLKERPTQISKDLGITDIIFGLSTKETYSS